MDSKSIVEFLNQFSRENDLINEAIKLGHEALVNYSEDYPDEEVNPKIYSFKFEFQELVFNHSFFKSEFIKTHIGIYQKGKEDGIKWASYILDTNLKAEHIDDVLVWE